MAGSGQSAPRRARLRRYGPIVLAALIVGAVLAPVVWAEAKPGTDGTVAVISLDQSIFGSTSQQVIGHLRAARQNDSIKAVVLQVNSPGGGAGVSEAIYLEVRQTAAEMPVVASVTGIGASGAYYAMLPADRIFVTPASFVGSVGVRASEPIQGEVPGEITTGPDKSGGATAEERRAQVETARRAFIGAVFAHRGDRLELTRKQVSHAKVYTGIAAVNNGMADEIGGPGAAIQAAADRAGLETYDVVQKELESTGFILLRAQDGRLNRTAVVPADGAGAPAVERPRLLMLFGELETTEVSTDAAG